MKPLYWILTIIALILVGVFLWIFVFSGSGGTSVSTSSPSGGFPDTPPGSLSSESTPGEITVPAQGGSNVAVKDFIHDPETIADPVNPGEYYLSGYTGCTGPDCSTTPSNVNFDILYDQKRNSFKITLYAEPVGKFRQEAEEELLKRLGASKDTLCKLSYSVATPSWVNEFYSAKNLGFSFCPGSTPL